MRIKFIAVSVAAFVAAWAPPGLARETIALPGTVTGEGVLNGVDTTGSGILTIGTQNINTNNNPGGAIIQSPASFADVRISGNSTVTGTVGSAPIPIFNINAGATAATVNFNGTLFATTLNVTGTGTVNFNGDVTAATNFAGDGFINLATGRSQIGAVTTATANTGTLTLGGGSSLIGAVGGASGVRQINVVGGNASITGAIQALNINLGANTLVQTGALTTNPGGTIATTLLSDLEFGHMNVSGASNINAGGITVIPTVTGVLTSGTNFRIIEAAAGTVGAPVFVVNNNPRYTFAGVPTTTGDVNILLASVAPLATIVTDDGAVAVAPVLDTIAEDGTDLLVIQNAIAVLPDGTAVNDALVQLAPGPTNLAAPWVAGQTSGNFDGLWRARVEEIQNRCCDNCDAGSAGRPRNVRTCMGAGQQSNWWAKGFGTWGRQRDMDGANGYSTRAAGAMLAWDGAVGDWTRIGLGAGYSHVDIDENTDPGQTDIDNYLITGYLNHAPGRWFAEGAVSVGKDEYDGSRRISFPGVDRLASADYSGWQFSGIVSTGMHFIVSETVITPLASLQVSRVHVNSYTESGAGDANLQVDDQSYGLVQSGLGAMAERITRSGRATFSSEMHGRWLHDFNSTTTGQDARFTGGGAVFTATGLSQGRDMYNVGAGFTYLSCNCGDNTWTVKALYDYRWNDNAYVSHQVSVIASVKF